MLQRLKRKVYSGCVLEVEVYSVETARVRDLRKAEPYRRFKDEAERKAHKQAIARKNFIRIVNENFDPESLYSTLTFNNENECHDFSDARILRDRFVRRLRYVCPDAALVIVMGRGKNTNRIHYHMISSGVPEAILREKWTYGEIVDVSHLKAHNYYDDGTGRRVDHGQDYTSLASYMFDHWSEEQAKVCRHRWKGTRNLRKPEKEDARPVKRNYTPERPPKTPKGYILVEVFYTKYGYINYKYVTDRQLVGSLHPDHRQYRGPDGGGFYRASLPVKRNPSVI